MTDKFYQNNYKLQQNLNENISASEKLLEKHARNALKREKPEALLENEKPSKKIKV